MANPEIIIPKDETEWLNLRVRDLTSTESSCLFGASPYMTLFELWHRKRNGVVIRIEESDRMKWGTRLQNPIAEGIAADHNLKIRPMPEYIRDSELRMGSSFDFAIENDGLLEIKNVDGLIYKKQWLEDGDTIEAPPHIELQVQHQLSVSGRDYAYLGALVGGNRVVLTRRTPDKNIISILKSKTAQFWESIEKGREPKPDFQRDSKFIAQLYDRAETGKIIDRSDDEFLKVLAEQYRATCEKIKELDEKKAGLKAQLLIAVGDAEKVKGSSFSISAGMIDEKEITYTRSAYRDFRVSWKRERA